MAAEIKPYNLYKSAGRDIYSISLPDYIHIYSAYVLTMAK